MRAGAVNQTSDNVWVRCSGGLFALVGVCLTYGGGGANDGGTPPRSQLVGPGGALLGYHLRRTGGGGALSQLFVEEPTLLGSGSTTVPIFADILSSFVQLPTRSHNTAL